MDLYETVENLRRVMDLYETVENLRQRLARGQKNAAVSQMHTLTGILRARM